MTDEMHELATRVLNAARKRTLKLVTAESCTGGGIAAALTDIAGSSDVFDRGFVTYSNDAKQDMLEVSEDTLIAFGAVSEETAGEMAEGARASVPGSMAISVTGIAGPDGGTPEKPVGLVCFGLARPDDSLTTQTKTFDHSSRAHIRAASVVFALSMMLDALEPV